MELEAVSIKRFRSIESVEVAECGRFNVLIGKNNSGKSNILSAIYAFFTCIEGGNVVTLAPTIGQEIDFFKRVTELPIEIALTFHLALAERDALIRDISTEAPQMKNALDGLDPSLRLSMTVCIAHRPVSYSFVSKIALGGTIRPGERKPDPTHTILGLGEEAASELHQKLLHVNQWNEEIQALSGLLPDLDSYGGSRLFAESQSESRRSSRLEMLLERHAGHTAPRLRRELEALIGEATSYDEFRRLVQAFETRKREEVAQIQEKPLRTKIDTFSGEEPSVPTYVQNLLRRVSDMKVMYFREHRDPIGEKEAEQLLSLKVTRGGPEILRSIQETVSALLGVQIDAFQSDSPSLRGKLPAEMDVDNFLVEVNGSGIREALRIVLDVEFENPSILLIEEPEVHLHPSLETSTMRYLKRISQDCQVFISTHSTNFLDTGEMKNVYLVSKPDATRVQLLNYAEAEAQIPSELGIRLSSLFMFDRLVFVEGPSDEAMVREWASTLRVNLSQSNVGFIHMGGVRNFTHFAAQATLSFLTRRQVRMWFVIDHDERDDADIARLKEMAGQNAIVRVLERRELENYLVCPRAITEFVRLKTQSAGNQPEQGLPSASNVEEVIEECAEKLRQMAVDKRVARIVCRPAYPSTQRLFEEPQEIPFVERATEEIQRLIDQLEAAKEGVQGAYVEQTESVGGAWQSRKLDLVPGDLLLDLVCKEYGVRFKKDRDSARLAALMNQEEIPQEITELINEIGGCESSSS